MSLSGGERLEWDLVLALFECFQLVFVFVREGLFLFFVGVNVAEMAAGSA